MNIKDSGHSAVSADSKFYFVGGGIASLSAAVYLIQDGKVKGENVVIFDESKRIGGSLDAQNLDTSDGYVMRGIRMFEEKAYTCSFDLMSRIPSLNMPGKNIREEFIEYNKKNKSYSKSRLLRKGQAIDSRPLGLSLKDRAKLLNLILEKESSLEGMEIQQYFTSAFFTSNFWYEFCTVFAFQPWHSVMEFRRYLIRFIQSFPSIDTLENIESSPYNQYEFLVLPVMDWLVNQGVTFMLNTKVTDVAFSSDAKGNKTVRSLLYGVIGGEKVRVDLGVNDYAVLTLGSMVAGSYSGSMKTAPLPQNAGKNFSWDLWERIAKQDSRFGVPSVFNSHVDKSKWTSFTITFRGPEFFELIDTFVHKKVTAYGGVNLIDSNWFMSIVLSYKPYFLNQPEGVNLCWGYGLSSDSIGNVVKKKMSECTGEEILTELIHHLGFTEHLEAILKTAVCIPCTTPYVTSQFLPRKKGDRPDVVPKGATNFAFLGQYVEIPDDVVFTVEYSIRSAQIAIHSLLKLKKRVTPMYRGLHHLRVVVSALRTLLR